MRRGGLLKAGGSRRIAGWCAGVLLGLAGCASSGASSTPSRAPADGATPTTSAVVVSVDVGQGVTARWEDGVDVSLTVDRVAVTASCPGRARPTQLPRHGYFVVLDVNVTVAAGTESTAVAMSAEDFRLAGPDGALQAISSTPESWACFEDGELLPPFLTAGTSSGRIVLDAATEHGAVLLDLPDGRRASWDY